MLSPANDSYLHHPTVHGDLVGFLADDDVWLAPLAGGRAWRVTADRAPSKDLRFSPDGTRLAHLSRRDGAPELHVVGVEGGASVRTTWWGDVNARVLGWAGDAHVRVATAWGQPLRARTWAREVPLDGGASTLLPHGPVTALDTAGTSTVLGTGFGGRRRDAALWKRYRGGTAGRLWVDGQGTGEFARLLPEVTAQLTHPMWVDGRIAFLSDDEGTGNVYSVAPDGTDLRRHTDHTDFYARHATSDGRRVVYAAGGELWVLDGLAADSEPRRLEITTGGPRHTPRVVPAGKHLGEVAVDATGRASALEVAGSVQWLTHADGPVRTLAPGSTSRARMPRVLGADVVWVDDATGEDALVVSTPGQAPRTLAAGELGRVVALAAAPDGHTLAVATHDGRVLLLDPADGAVREVDRTDDGHADSLVFSPDSAWLAWTHPGHPDLTQVRLARLSDLVVTEVTPLRFSDTEPVFTLDGRHLALLSARTFDPVYDEHVFDLGFPASTRPQLVPLVASTPSPFAPSLLGAPTAAPVAPEVSSEDAGLVVDLEGLAARVVAVPVPAGRLHHLLAVRGGLVWLRESVHGVLGDDQPGTAGAEKPRPVLEHLALTTGVLTTLAEGVDDVWVSGDGTRLVLRDGEKLRSVPADRKAGQDAAKGDPSAAVEIDLGRVRAVVDTAAQWQQMFDENGRLMRDHFWVADMAGNDWSAQLARYRPLVARCATRDDLSDVLWETVAELGTSHAYETPPEEPRPGARTPGYLGVDLERTGDAWRITRVVPGETSSPGGRSPLAAPGVAAQVGEAVVAVDGRAVDPATGPAPLLLGTADTPVALTLEGPHGPRTVVVVPLGAEMPLRYFDWVAGRRAAVHAASDGRLGYLHVPDMMGIGWAQLHRDLHTEITRDALVLDVRSNGGGHTSQLVVEKLARQLTGWSVPRHKQAGTYPADVRRGPMVTVTDENAGSDGDIVTAMIQARGLGPVVGVRSWGGVVGIDGEFSLVDGTAVTQPRYATWIAGHGWAVENHGTDPDVEVAFPPQAWAAGEDPQLDVAIRTALEALEATPAQVAPSTEDRPSKATPELGPRP